MTEIVDPRAEIRIEPIESGIEYAIFVRNPGEKIVERRWRPNRKIEQGTEHKVTFNPLELGLENTIVCGIADDPTDIDLFLPNDPVAGLEWEGLCNGRMLRRKQWNGSLRRSPIRGPFHLGMVSAVPSEFGEYIELGDEISGWAGKKALDVTTVDASDWDKFDAEIKADRFQCLHVLFKTELTPDGPQALIGTTRVPFDWLVQKVAQRGTRFVVLQDVTADRHGMAALRVAAQNVSPSCETSFLLCNGSPSHQYFGDMKGWYRSLLHDEPLVQCMTHLDREYQRGGISLVCHAGSERPLGLIDAVDIGRRSLNQIRADSDRLGEPIDTTGFIVSNDSIDVPAGQGAEAPLTELAEVGSTTQKAEQELKQTIQKRETAEGNQPRYPAAWFYLVDTERQTPIPDTETLTWPPPQGFGLEFHFWLDLVKTGISSITDVPEFHAPNDVPYPLTLLVSVWSNDFEFETREQSVEVNAGGRTEHARFPVRKMPPAPREAELFLFIRHQGTLIAAFRVLAQITEATERKAGAQLIEHAYVTSEWFQFEKAPAASALTIFITKRHGNLQIFTFKPTGDPWARVGPTEDNLYESNKQIYGEVQALARRAEQALKSGAEFGFAKEAKYLAQLGYPLFGSVFLQGESGDAGIFADEYLGKLPEGSSLTIAIGKEAQNLFIPWGLLYDRQPPFDYFDTPSPQGFLGYRYNLVVRPSTPHDGPEPRRQLPVRIGAAWLEHEETAALRAFYEKYQEEELVLEPIRVHEHRLPALAERSFDLIEFFCHGHTKVPSGITAHEAAELIKSFKQYGETEEIPSLLMAIDAVGNSDSLLDLGGGFVTLTSLADTLKKPMPGRPLILLSMCESAQVSAGGVGFVPLFLRRGARAVIGTEGPTLWSLSRQMDTQIIARLLEGETIGEAFYETRKKLATTNVLALIYTLYGDAAAKLVEIPLPATKG